MADEEISILIKAVNEASAVLNKVKKDTKDLTDTSEENNNKLSNSFTKVQGAMLNLGQAAQSIHNIFEIYQNKTRLLENATDRLQNAQIRLKQATKDLAESYKKLDNIEKKHSRDMLSVNRATLNLEEAQKNLEETTREYGETSLESRQAQLDLIEAQMDLNDANNLGKEKTEELAEANQDLIDKSELLIISQNNVEKSQRGLDKALGDAKWMYLDMGLAGLSAAGNLVTAYTNIMAKNGETMEAIGSLKKVAAGGIGLYFAYQGIQDVKSGKEIAGLGELFASWGAFRMMGGKSGGWMIAVGVTLKVAFDQDAMDSVVKFGMKVVDWFTTLFKGFWDWITGAGWTGGDMGLSNIGEAGQKAGADIITENTLAGRATLGIPYDRKSAAQDILRPFWEEQKELIKQGLTGKEYEDAIYKLGEKYRYALEDAEKLGYGIESMNTIMGIGTQKTTQLNDVTNTLTTSVNEYSDALNKVPKEIDTTLQLNTVMNNLGKSTGDLGGGINKRTGNYNVIYYDVPGGRPALGKGTPEDPYHDFVMRPGQKPISFSSDDTIIGTKKGIGNNVYIEITGPIYGVNATEISRSIAQELGGKLSL